MGPKSDLNSVVFLWLYFYFFGGRYIFFSLLVAVEFQRSFQNPAKYLRWKWPKSSTLDVWLETKFHKALYASKMF